MVTSTTNRELVDMDDYVVMALTTYDRMQMQHNVLIDNYQKKELDLDLMGSTMRELLGLYLERIAFTFKVKECDNKLELINPESPNFILMRADYAVLLSMGIEKELIIEKLREVVANHG